MSTSLGDPIPPTVLGKIAFSLTCHVFHVVASVPHGGSWSAEPAVTGTHLPAQLLMAPGLGRADRRLVPVAGLSR